MYTAMIVHESWVMREIIKEDLTECGYRVVCGAKSRLEAVLLYRLLRPDLVLIRVTSDDMGGRRAIDDILEIDSKAKIITIVGPSDDVAALHALVSGAKGLLVIPSTVAMLKDETERVMNADAPSPALPHVSIVTAFGRVVRKMRTIALRRHVKSNGSIS